jgi:hypothetical protein
LTRSFTSTTHRIPFLALSLLHLSLAPRVNIVVSIKDTARVAITLVAATTTTQAVEEEVIGAGAAKVSAEVDIRIPTVMTAASHNRLLLLS